MNSHSVNIAVFASGAGSNAKKIIEFFNHPQSNTVVALIVCNNPAAGVIHIAREAKIPVLMIQKADCKNGSELAQKLKNQSINFIALAGFLWKIPRELIAAYPGKIVNIHPALLPKYGGKGMYGGHVHQAVLASGDKESGITIHFVDEHYDHGKSIFKATCPVEAGDSVDALATRVHRLEHQYYPAIIQKVVENISDWGQQ